MAKVEEMQTGKAPSTAPRKNDVSAEDLKTIAALQTEFRKELAELKGRVDNLEERVSKLERAKLSGSVTFMYRDRLAADPALSTASGDANLANSPFQDAFSANDAMPVRVKSHLGIHGALTPWATYHGNLHIDEMGFGQAAGRSTVAAGHRGYEGLLGSPVFIEDSFVALGSWPLAHKHEGMMSMDSSKHADGGLLLAAGLMNFGHFINPGTRIKNHFGNVGWMGRGYGMLGFGGNNAAAGAGSGALPRFWGSGFDVSAVDPDSADYNHLSAPSLALGAGWGPVTLALGTNAGSFYADRKASLQDLGINGMPASVLTGTTVGTSVRGDAILGTQNTNVAAGQFGTADLLNLPSQYNDGYSVASLDLDFGKPVGNDVFPVRLNASLGQFNNDGLFGFGANRSNLSFALDLAGDAFGIALQGNKGFLQPDKTSLGIFMNDIGGSGFGWGLGTNMAGRDLLVGNFAGLLDANAALYLVLPTFDGFLPQIVVGARQGLSNGTLSFLGAPAANTALPMGNSGLTASATYNNIGGSGWGLRAEYSSLMKSEFWNFAAVTHDLSVFSTYKF